MDENEKSGKLADRDRKATRMNKALRENLRKRKAETANPDGIMQRRTSIISKRTGPKLRRPDDGSGE
ncbi:MAG: hypothetical protein JKX91_07970 [Rhizobiaceae bacterium]|nr:hypothetical protein [Rhizobiaceae bacterium]